MRCLSGTEFGKAPLKDLIGASGESVHHGIFFVWALYQEGSGELPQNMVLEKQNVIIEELKQKLDLNIEDMDKLTTDDLRQLVDSAIGKVSQMGRSDQVARGEQVCGSTAPSLISEHRCGYPPPGNSPQSGLLTQRKNQV